MESYLFYIAKSALAAGAFYLAFLLLFQNQKHFAFNRIYLPVSLALSFIIPLITFTTINYIEPVSIQNFNSFAYLPESTAVIQEQKFVFEWYHYIFGLYILGSLGFLFRLILGHLKAILIIKKSRVQQLFTNWVNITQKDVHPFSFFNKIVLSEKTISHPNLKMIVEHENIHVKEKHTLDILIAEILFLFQWFNPFAWLLKDAIKNNLEYITDHEIAKNHNPKTYQLAMVSLADKKGVAPFLNALNGSQLKNRIIMMKKKTENKYAFLKQLIVLPLLAVLVMGLSNKEVRTEIVQPEIKDEINISDGDPLKMVDKAFLSQIYQDGIFTLQDYGENAPLLFLNGKEVIEKVVFNETDLKFGKNMMPEEAMKIYGERGKNGAMLFNTEEEFEWPNPIKTLIVNVDGKVIDLDNPKLKEYDTTKGFDSGTVIDALELNGKVEANALDFGKGNATLYIQTSDYKVGTNPDFDNVFEANKKAIETKETFYAVNNEIVSKAFFEYYGKNGFESVVVLTGKDASEKYGNNFETVIDAKTGAANFQMINEKVVKGKVTDQNDNPLEGVSVIVKNKPLGTITDGNGNFIIEIEEKDKTLIFSYLDIDKKEVDIENAEINIQLETNKKGEKPIRYITGKLHDGTLRLRNSKGEMVKPMYIVNGEESQSLDDLSPGDLLSMSVLKDDLATKYYGLKGKNGVVQIGTKDWKFTEDSNPLIIVDDEEYTGKINDIPQEKIFHVRELRYPNFTEKYGEKGKNGVIEIETTKMRKVSPLINNERRKPDGLLSATFGNKTDLNNLLGEDQKQKKQDKKDPIFYKVEEMPEFPGGETALKNYIATSIKYPEIAKENGIQGTVYVKFIIDKAGKVTNPEIAKGVDPSLDKEALRIANTLPNWKPGKQRGKAVDVEYTIPVNFELPSLQNFNKTLMKKNVSDDIDSKNTRYDSENDILIPQGFSPNGDGIHDVFEVRGLENKYPNFKMKIFNSKRDLIWEYKHNGDPNSKPEWWNGKNNKNKIEKGTYYYEIEYNGSSKIKNSAGTFILSQ